MRGDDYTTTETYTERDASGNTVTRDAHRRPHQLDSVSGEVQHFFDDVLVCGSKSVPATSFAAWSRGTRANWNRSRTSSSPGSRPSVTPLISKTGLVIAKRLMEPTIHNLIRQDIGGDHQQIGTANTRYLGVTFKHCLLPVWIANYRYQDKLFQILINGRTGTVSGERPYSFWKIAALVLAIVVVAALIITMVMTMQKGSGQAPGPPAPRHRTADAPVHFYLPLPGFAVLRPHPPTPSPRGRGGADLAPSPPGFAGGEGWGEGGTAKSPRAPSLKSQARRESAPSPSTTSCFVDGSIGTGSFRRVS